MSPHQLFALALLACPLVACASRKSGSSSADDVHAPVRIGFLEYRTEQKLELVNASHTDPLAQYSRVRESANRKVQDDEIVGDLVAYFEQQGFRERAQSGPAPAKSDGRTVWALELEQSGRTTHVEARKDDPSGDLERFKAMLDAFVQVYNATYSLQAVERKLWDTPALGTAPKVQPSPPKPGTPPSQPSHREGGRRTGGPATAGETSGR